MKKSYSRATQLRYLAAGKCQQCGKRPISKKSTVVCATCLAAGSEASRNKRARYIAEGRCAQCGGARENPDCQRCELCNEKHNIRTLERRAERKRQGMCTSCGKRPPDTGRLRCAECIARAYRRANG